jgi:hypothetical protein
MAKVNGQIRQLKSQCVLRRTTKDTDWEEAIPAVVRGYNSSTNATTGYTPDELVFGFQPRRPLPTATDNRREDQIVNRLDASDATPASMPIQDKVISQ